MLGSNANVWVYQLITAVLGQIELNLENLNVAAFPRSLSPVGPVNRSIQIGDTGQCFLALYFLPPPTSHLLINMGVCWTRTMFPV